MGAPTAVVAATARLLVVHLLLATVVVAAGVVAQHPASTPDPVDDPDPSTPTRVEVLLDTHDCWTGAAPAHVGIPGHVVITRPGEAPVYVGTRVTGRALEQVVDGVDHGLTIHGFCV